MVRRLTSMSYERRQYTLHSLAGHLALAGKSDQLHSLISQPWMDVKYEQFGSHEPFAADVRTAMDVAAGKEQPDLARLGRHCLLYATLGTHARAIPTALTGILVRLGQVRSALGYAGLMPEPDARASAYRFISEAMQKQNRSAEAQAALDRALVSARQIPQLTSRTIELSAIAQALVRARSVEEALDVPARWRRLLTVQKHLPR